MTIDERLDAIARDLETLTRIHIDRDREYQARFDEVQTEYRTRIKAAEERHDKEMAAIRADLRRAVRLSVIEARQERAKRRELAAHTIALRKELAEHTKELDLKITQLAAAQLVTEEKLQRFLEARRGNGNPPPQ